MVTLSSPCRAKDPATCDFHGYEVRVSAYVAMGQYDEAFAELATRGRAGIEPEDIAAFIAESTPYIKMPPTQAPYIHILVDNVGVHTSHCCNIHGCKYGDEDCPVKTGTNAQQYACEMCDWNTQTYEDKYGKPKTFYKQVTAIHPDNCTCPTCATGTTVPENTWRGNARAGDIKNALWQTTKNETGKTLTALLEATEFTHSSANKMQTIIRGDDADDEYENDTWGK